MQSYIRFSTIYLHEHFKQVKGEKLEQLAIFAKITICKFSGNSVLSSTKEDHQNKLRVIYCYSYMAPECQTK